MCGVRILVKTLYDLFRTGGYSKRIFIYGTKDGGISLAKSIRNETASQYTLKGFISSDVEMSGKWLMGLPVYSEKEDVVRLMNHLPENQREVLRMRFFEDLSFKEIADATGVSINTALGRMRYAIMNLRKLAEDNDVFLCQ